MPEISPSVKAFEIALTAKEPIKEILNLAANYVEAGNREDLHDIDIMLIDRYIEFLRRGTKDDLSSFLYSILAFVDSKTGDKLKESEEGKKYFYRWEHFRNLCNIAIENYDPEFISRLISSRRHANELMNLLFQNSDGIRHNELAKTLGISEPHLSKLLREFEEHDLIVRERRNKVSTVKLGFAGRAYMAGSGVASVEDEKISKSSEMVEYRESCITESGAIAQGIVGFENPYYSGHSLRDILMGCPN